MAYNTTTRVITAPVGVRDVQRALGVSSDDVGTLCRAANVNMWAKYKPVPLVAIDTTGQLKADKTWKTEDDLAVGVVPWWKGTNKNCGISFNTFGSVANCKNAIDQKAIVWSRLLPTSYFRLVDFNQYNRQALAPVSDVGVSNITIQSGATIKVQAARSPDAGDNITLAHLYGLKDYYFTVAFYDASGNLKLLHSADETFGDMDEADAIDMEIPYSSSNGGYGNVFTNGQTYKVYSFISSVKYNCATSEAGGSPIYIPLPCESYGYGIQPVEVEANSYQTWMTVDASVLLDGNRIVSWTAYMYGATQSAEISLRDLNGNVVKNPSTGEDQRYTVDFANGTVVSNPTTGRKVQSGLNTSLTLPDTNYEAYRVWLVSTGLSTVKAIIGYSINVNS